MDKTYRNGPGGAWNARIRWFGQSDGRVKLKMESPEGESTVMCSNATDAQILWENFKKKWVFIPRKR